MSEEEVSEGIDLTEIEKRYATKGYFARLGDMFKGLGMPHNTGEYKLARIELQRQAAPICATLFVVLFVGVTAVLTMSDGGTKKTIEVQIADIEEQTDIDETPEEEPTPPDPEPPPIEEVDIVVDVPNPGPVSLMTPTPSPPSQQVTVKPAPQDSVAIVDSPVKMKSMTGSRTPGSIGAMTNGGSGYGDANTEAAVLKVLWFLKGSQRPDGSWQSSRTKRTNPCVLSDTALAVLTYLAHGEYPGSPSNYKKDFGPVVQAGIEFLINSLENGSQGPRMKGSDGNEYAFLIATYALCEAYGMTKNPQCKDVAMVTLKRIIDSQSSTGGWDYKLNAKSTRDDLSYAGWALQALKAGKMAGMHPDGLEECIKKAISCLKKRNWKGKNFSYVAGGNQHSGLTATGCLAMQLLGYNSEPEVRGALDYMRGWHPAFDKATSAIPNGDNNCIQYYSYYATQCKYQAGMRQGANKPDMDTWQKWNAEMKKLYPSSIIDLPNPVKDVFGKDHKQGYYDSKSDQWTSGEVMASCLAALQLMVYYRYLPTNQLSATADDKADAGATAVDKGNDVVVDVDI